MTKTLTLQRDETSLAMDTPVGRLVLAADGRALTTVWLDPHSTAPASSSDDPILIATRRQLEEYFRGERTTFDLPLAPRGTAFQQRVWRALLQIPHGETWSYQRLARTIGRPAAVRAVGASNGRNPIPIIIPCHRVIGADGSLTGYGGGLPMKKWLLAHEAARTQPRLPL